ncbi:hypothetical protein K466DRAFT_583217 [Polyporus arcularius HHB13444]|uniref:Uncharacterized protein n=1 Tax=Polyporus arcularius HHB13444 TaxID=1314778 RepID=A0A5C3PNV2_9APHY|nr:hypothetical protein K466DRAFT_583217 [Polyporus arcularius HHB13444]
MAPLVADSTAPNGPPSLELIIAIAGSSALFVAIVVGFCIVARKKCLARSPETDVEHVHAYRSPRGSPIASVDRSRCPLCLSKRRRAQPTQSIDSTFSHLPLTP